MSAKKRVARKPAPQLGTLKLILRSLGLEFVEELQFDETRKWRFDLAVPDLKIGIEYHGLAGLRNRVAVEDRKRGLMRVSGHSTVSGLTSDCEKMNAAALTGWRVLAFTALHFCDKKRTEHKLTAPLEVLKRAMNSAR